MRYRRLPMNLRQQVHEYYYQKYHGQLFNEEGILTELSHPLREVRGIIVGLIPSMCSSICGHSPQQRIISHNCQDLVRIVPFFANADPMFITSVVTRLKPEVFLPGDFVIRQGTFGSKMYFIQHGRVDIITSDGRVATSLCDGSYFGGKRMSRRVRPLILILYLCAMQKSVCLCAVGE